MRIRRTDIALKFAGQGAPLELGNACASDTQLAKNVENL
jgi:hypothetical protein